MPIYLYECNLCSKEYSEKRLESQPQFFNKCECGGIYISK